MNDLNMQFLFRFAIESSICLDILFEIRNCDLKLSRTRLYFSYNVFYYLFVCESVLLIYFLCESHSVFTPVE